jgi:hypothetical protein
MKNKCAFYLKINRNEGYTIRNLRHWLEIVREFGDSVDYYIICDNQELKNKVVDEISGEFPEIQEKFFGSIITEETSYIIKKVTNERWEMAGFAHISTFIHARDNGYDKFWNIDADDTRFCLNPIRCRELLHEAERYAIDNKVDCFSLDMHASLIGSGKHWSFGITYTNNALNWIQIMQRACTYNLEVEDACPNIDRFFRYIRNNMKEAKIESFYVENLKFIHYSNDFFWRLSESALFHWKEGYLTLPIMYYGVGLRNKESHMAIDPIVVKLDMNISDEETMISMLKACNTPYKYIKSIMEGR